MTAVAQVTAPVMALLLTACSGEGKGPRAAAPDSVWTAPIQTDAAAYAARPVAGAPVETYAFAVVARFTNRTDSTVFLARGMPDQARPDVRVLPEDGRGASAYTPLYDAVGHDRQIAVGPGDTRVDTFRLRGPTAWEGDTGEPSGPLDGELRLAYRAQGCRGDGACPLPDAVAISNTFTVSILDNE